jgi:hypothetical protein
MDNQPYACTKRFAGVGNKRRTLINKI